MVLSIQRCITVLLPFGKKERLSVECKMGRIISVYILFRFLNHVNVLSHVNEPEEFFKSAVNHFFMSLNILSTIFNDCVCSPSWMWIKQSPIMVFWGCLQILNIISVMLNIFIIAISSFCRITTEKYNCWDKKEVHLEATDWFCQSASSKV